MKHPQLKKYLYMSLTLFGAFALSIMFFFVIFRAQSVSGMVTKIFTSLRPFVFGAIIAYILRPMCNMFERLFTRLLMKIKAIKEKRAASAAKTVSITLCMIVFVLVIYLLLSMVIPQIASSIPSIIDGIPTFYRSVIDWANKLVDDNSVIMTYIEEFTSGAYDSIVNWLRNDVLPMLTSLLNGFSSSVASGVFNAVVVMKDFFIGVIAAIYFLSCRKKLAAQSKLIISAIFNDRWSRLIVDEFRFIDRTFTGFIMGKVVDSAIIGVVCFIVMSIFGWQYAMLISVIIGVTNIIPFFGPFIGAIPSVIILLIVDPMTAVYFLIFIVILQQIDGNILGPSILGNSTGLSSFWVLFSLLLFGGLFGFAGMILGVPVFAVIYDLVKRLVNKKLVHNGEGELMEQYHQEFNDGNDSKESGIKKLLNKTKKKNAEQSTEQNSENK